MFNPFAFLWLRSISPWSEVGVGINLCEREVEGSWYEIRFHKPRGAGMEVVLPKCGKSVTGEN